MSTALTDHEKPGATDQTPGTPALLTREFVLPFILVTSLFALWGFANDVTNPMVAAFKNILLISNTQSSLVQTAFYGGYCLMAIPAALFIKRFSYKSGLTMGLALYAIGCLLFIPAGGMMAFWAFLLAYFIMTCGLSFLETIANPYVLAMGDERTATRRLNLAQSFNPMGSLAGMFVAKEFILARLDSTSEAGRRELLATAPDQFARIQASDLGVITVPYVILGMVVLAILVVFALARLPGNQGGGELNLGPTLKRLFRNKHYLGGVVAQAFYVGAQIMVWTFIIQYAELTLGMPKTTAQGYNMVAMVIFVSSRFICTFLLKYVSPGHLLLGLALGGGALTLGVIFAHGMNGLYCLVGISACMSLMFPTIYGIALHGLGDDAKLASAGLILAIGGGAAMPPLQAAIIDLGTVDLGFMSMAAVRASFVLPLVCFMMIAIYGYRAFRMHRE